MSVLSQFCLPKWKSVESLTPTALVYNLSSDSILTCSDDESNSLEFSKVYPEPSSQKTIFSSVIFCIHRKEGCDWTGELRKLKAHLLSCTLDAIPCHLHCQQRVSRLAHEDHVRNFCPNRRQSCEFCHIDFSGVQYDSHMGSCTMEPIYCDNKCGMKISRKQMMQHKSSECPKRMVCCLFKEAGCRYKGPRYSLEKHQEDVQRQHLLLMCGLASRQQQQLSALRSTVSRISTNYTGTFLWRINDVGIKINEATIKEGFELISAPFYTSQYGYKLRLRCFSMVMGRV